MKILIIILILVFLYWFFILRPGRLNFWKIASKYPDKAYDFFMSEECWKVFEEKLPENYHSIVPKSSWTGPFQLLIPKIGNKVVYIFGKYPVFEEAQKKFMAPNILDIKRLPIFV